MEIQTKRNKDRKREKQRKKERKKERKRKRLRERERERERESKNVEQKIKKQNNVKMRQKLKNVYVAHTKCQINVQSTRDRIRDRSRAVKIEQLS